LGKHNRGENSGNAKLTYKDIKEIRVVLKEGKMTQQQIADRYGVHQAAISKIKLGKRWK